MQRKIFKTKVLGGKRGRKFFFFGFFFISVLFSGFFFESRAKNFFHEEQWTKTESFQVPIQKGDRLVVRGFFGKIRLRSKKEDSAIKELSHLNLRFRWDKKSSFISQIFSSKPLLMTSRENSHISLEVKAPSFKADTLLVEKESPILDLEIEGPSLPTEIYMKKANIEITDWFRSLRIVSLDSQIKLVNTEGEVILFGQRGEVKISEHKGDVEIESYQLNLNLEKVKGGIRIENFVGKAFLSSIRGPIQLISFKGPIEVWQSQGSLTFDHYYSPLKIQNWRGSLKGKSLNGDIEAILLGRAAAFVETEVGNIMIRAVNSGAYVRATFKEGTLLAPYYFKRLRLEGGWKRKSGVLRRGQPGKIVVKSRKGNIRIR